MIKYLGINIKGFSVSPISFFSISYDLIAINIKIPYDLYVNSSSKESSQKFIRVFPEGQEITIEDVERFKEKYQQLYVPELQRSSYMRSLVQDENVDDTDTMSFIKDSAIEYLHKVFDPKKEFSTELLHETILGCKDAVEGMIDTLDDYDIDGLRRLIGNLSGHDFYTYDHSINVSMYCITILRLLKPTASRTELTHVGLGGLLHDLGKVKIPTEILNSPGGLTDDEFKVIKTHPDLGLELLLDNDEINIESLDLTTIARVVHEHHENWDGGGYPQGIKEKEIHVFARICSIADFFDAITTKRSYSDVVAISQAMNIMEKTVEKKIDPLIYKVFANHVSASNVISPKDLKMSDTFDPSVPWAEFPLEEIKEMFEDEDFGKIKFIEDIEEANKKKKEKKSK